MNLQPFPPSSQRPIDDRGHPVWPRGYWLSTGGLVCANAAEHGRGLRARVIPAGRVMFLTGVAGEVLCAAHMPPIPEDAP